MANDYPFVSKKELSEMDIRTKFITPAIEKAGWSLFSQMREECSITKGRIIARGKTCKREKPLKADYVLFYKPNKPIAIVEAKDNNHSIGDGMQQALNYANMMDIPFDIPEEWEWCKLGELTRLITKGSSPSWQGVSYTSKGKGILFVTSENVGTEKMLLAKRKYVEAKFNDMHPASILRKGDLLTNIVGASIGRTAVFNEEVLDANINQAVCIIRLANYSLTAYLLMYLNSSAAIKNMTDKSVDSARANLSLTSVTNLMVPIPPLAEQQRIVDRVNELLAICEGFGMRLENVWYYL